MDFQQKWELIKQFCIKRTGVEEDTGMAKLTPAVN